MSDADKHAEQQGSEQQGDGEWQARLRIGQLVHHKLLDYRAVIMAIDATFQSTNNWYETMAPSQPPKDEPWYHVLIHDVAQSDYVAECDLEPDLTGEPINHPALERIFQELHDGIYRLRQPSN